jgi:hypothetical protein
MEIFGKLIYLNFQKLTSFKKRTFGWKKYKINKNKNVK